MPNPAELRSASPTLSARIRKTFPSPAREFSLDVDFHAAPGFTILFGASGQERPRCSIAWPDWPLQMQGGSP